MNLRLGEKQEWFFRFNHKLDDWLLAQAGVEVRGGEFWRHPDMAHRNSITCRVCGLDKGVAHWDHKFKPVGIADSNHCRKLATDKNIFVNGVWQTKSSDLADVGAKWKSMSTSAVTCCWGGDFRNPDGNHFSFLHGKVR
jgi:hypothetical protein